MKKYCCDKFKIDTNVPSTTAPNIRKIIYLPNTILGDLPLFSFYITIGYEKFDILQPKLTIDYCPYCGIKLRDWYKSDEYNNEIQGDTF